MAKNTDAPVKAKRKTRTLDERIEELKAKKAEQDRRAQERAQAQLAEATARRDRAQERLDVAQAKVEELTALLNPESDAAAATDVS